VVQNWVTVKDTSTFYSEHIQGAHHHGLESIIAVSVFLGAVWAFLVFVACCLSVYAWHGYPND